MREVWLHRCSVEGMGDLCRHGGWHGIARRYPAGILGSSAADLRGTLEDSVYTLSLFYWNDVLLRKNTDLTNTSWFFVWHCVPVFYVVHIKNECKQMDVNSFSKCHKKRFSMSHCANRWMSIWRQWTCLQRSGIMWPERFLCVRTKLDRPRLQSAHFR